MVEKRLDEINFSELPLPEALIEACKLWKEGMGEVENEENDEDEEFDLIVSDTED